MQPFKNVQIFSLAVESTAVLIHVIVTHKTGISVHMFPKPQ
jgi:hypothetical protein